MAGLTGLCWCQRSGLLVIVLVLWWHASLEGPSARGAAEGAVASNLRNGHLVGRWHFLAEEAAEGVADEADYHLK